MIFKTKLLLSLGTLGVLGGTGVGVYYLKNASSGEKVVIGEGSNAESDSNLKVNEDQADQQQQTQIAAVADKASIPSTQLQPGVPSAPTVKPETSTSDPNSRT